ncbi:hypothetical protein BSKO_05233 [Bryopsis sp. KO-2023]|nr:hypothetical protein BSKO_05233 [Bryopsis sp. KO-2023]
MEERRNFYEKLQDFHRQEVVYSDEVAGYAIYRARCCYSDAIVALKIYTLQKLNKEKKEQVLREVDITSKQDCPFFIKCFDAFEDGDSWVLVLEHCAGGDLGSVMDSCYDRDHGWVASQVVYLLLQTVQFLHSKSYVHRSIDPHHVYFNSSGIAKLTGFHNLVDTQLVAPREAVGLLPYMAPEMVRAERSNIRTPYDCKVDIWSLGVMTFELLAGHLPFEDDNLQVLADKIIAFEPEYPKHWSPTLKDFMKLALQKDPYDRATASQLLEHPWVLNRINWTPDEDFENPVVVEEGRTESETLEEFQAKPDGILAKLWKATWRKVFKKEQNTEQNPAKGDGRWQAGVKAKAKPLISPFHGESVSTEAESSQELCDDTFRIAAELEPNSVLTMMPPDGGEKMHEVIRMTDIGPSESDDVHFLPSKCPPKKDADDSHIDLPSSSIGFETPRLTQQPRSGSKAKVHPFAFDSSCEETLVDIIPQAPTPTPTQKRPSNTRTPDPTPSSPEPAQRAVEMQMQYVNSRRIISAPFGFAFKSQWKVDCGL